MKKGFPVLQDLSVEDGVDEESIKGNLGFCLSISVYVNLVTN